MAIACIIQHSRAGEQTDRLCLTSCSPADLAAAIAEQTGFVDASHFHRRFAEVYGCSPAEYRRRLRG